MSNEEAKVMGCLVIIAVVGLIGCVMFMPSCNLAFKQQMTGVTGSDWLVVQFDAYGKVVKSWELHDDFVHNEGQSDGIYFKDSDGNIVHLSGFYTYVQVSNWDAARAKYLSE